MTKIERAYKSVSANFTTPHVLELFETEDGRLLELSTGTGIDHRNIWGVTEFEMVEGKLQTTTRGQMHTSAQSARTHRTLYCMQSFLGCNEAR